MSGQAIPPHTLYLNPTRPPGIPPIAPPVPRRRDSLPTPIKQNQKWLVTSAIGTMSQVETTIDDPHPSYTFEAKSMCKDSYKTLHEFFQNGILYDVEVKVGEKCVKCHRVILACVSRYFRTMFTSEMSESRQSVITIKDIEESAMEQLINFAYTSRITLTIDNVQSLLYASSILQVEIVAQACCEFMKTHLHPSNCIGIRTFGEQHGRKELMERADSYILDHFLDVVDSDEYLTMSPKHLRLLLSSPDLNVNREQEVYDAVMKWIKHSESNRKQHMASLISCVKLPLLPATYLMDKAASEELLKKDLECRDFLDEAKYYQLSQAQVVPNIKHSDRMRPRKSYAGVIFCVGGRGASGDPFKSIECYDLRRDVWFPVAEMSTRRRHVGVVSVNGKLFAIGGHDGSDHLNTGEVFDPTSNKWKPIAPMATLRRRGIALACLGGPIYAVGGLDDSTCFNIVERYDPESDQWSFVQAMLMPRGGVAVAPLKGHLYAIGGNDGAASLDSCERYDPHLNKWSMVATMNKRRAGAGVAELHGKLYVIGGFDDNSPLDSVECYDPAGNAWTMVAKMSCPRGGVGVATLAGKIYAVGGHDGTNYLSTVEAYDPLVDSWEQAAGIGVCRAGAGIAVVMCRSEHLKDISKLNMTPAEETRLEESLGKKSKVCCVVKCSIIARTSVVLNEQSANAINNNVSAENSGNNSAESSASNSIASSVNNLTLYLTNNSSASGSPENRSPDLRRNVSVENRKSRSPEARLRSPLLMKRASRSLSRSPEVPHMDPMQLRKSESPSSSPDTRPKRPVSMATGGAEDIRLRSPDTRVKRPISSGGDCAEYFVKGLPSIRIKRFAKFPKSQRPKSDGVDSGSSSPNVQSPAKTAKSSETETGQANAGPGIKPNGQSDNKSAQSTAMQNKSSKSQAETFKPDNHSKRNDQESQSGDSASSSPRNCQLDRQNSNSIEETESVDNANANNIEDPGEGTSSGSRKVQQSKTKSSKKST